MKENERVRENATLAYCTNVRYVSAFKYDSKNEYNCIWKGEVGRETIILLRRYIHVVLWFIQHVLLSSVNLQGWFYQ